MWDLCTCLFMTTEHKTCWDMSQKVSILGMRCRVMLERMHVMCVTGLLWTCSGLPQAWPDFHSLIKRVSAGGSEFQPLKAQHAFNNNMGPYEGNNKNDAKLRAK